jgi:hypothetical protein
MNGIAVGSKQLPVDLNLLCTYFYFLAFSYILFAFSIICNNKYSNKANKTMFYTVGNAVCSS